MENAKPQFPPKALHFMGILYSDEGFYNKAIQYLCSHFGEISMQSAPINWNYSNYYREELGENIIRRFIFFRNFIEQSAIADIKIITNGIEKQLSYNDKRNVNIDPGYLTLAKIVLASTKDYSHRIYLKNGVYAEVTLIFKKKCFIPHINTYKDYQDQRCLDIFLNARRLFKIISRD